MKTTARAKILSREHSELLNDRRTRRVFQFLQSKGLFFAFPRPKWSGKISFGDFEWVAQYVEPRVFEVLPAAALRFPGHLKGRPGREFAEFLAQLEEGKEADYHGISGRKISFWLNAPLPDRRTRPASERRVLKAFRLLPANAKKIEALARARGVSETDVIDNLIGGEQGG